MLKTYQCQTREVRIYVGDHIGYSPDCLVTEGYLRGTIWQFQEQESGAWQPPLRMTKTQFLYAGGVEDGWEITGLWYPPKPPDRVGQLFEYMERLAQFIQKRFGQKRVTVIGPTQTFTYEDPEVESRH